jgi:hypothetical protein
VAVCVAARAPIVTGTALRDVAASLILLVTLAGTPAVTFPARLDVALAEAVAAVVVAVVAVIARDPGGAPAPTGVSAATRPARRRRWRRGDELG